MASISITASFLGGGGSAGVASKQLPTTVAAGRRGTLLAVTASKVPEGEKVIIKGKEEGGSNGRRDLVFAVAAAAACGLAKEAMAGLGEPKPGSPEAKKKYAPVCVTMPTARICHK